MARLVEVVRDLEARAKRESAAEAVLRGGLRLRYVIAGGQRVLRMWREDVLPSFVEESVIKVTFEIPAEAVRVAGERGIEWRWGT